MTLTRQNKRKEGSPSIEDTARHAVAFIYQLAYCQSKRCNWFQRDLANYVYYHGLSADGIQALHAVGLTVGRSKFYQDMHDVNHRHNRRINEVLKLALEKKKLVVVFIDDNTNIHTRRQCDTNSQANNSHMATILVRLFDIPSVHLQEMPSNMPGGINIDELENAFGENMALLFSTFATTAPRTLLNIFFDPQHKRLRLTTHLYGEHNDVRQMRGVQNAHLIDSVEQITF